MSHVLFSSSYCKEKCQAIEMSYWYSTNEVAELDKSSLQIKYNLLILKIHGFKEISELQIEQMENKLNEDNLRMQRWNGQGPNNWHPNGILRGWVGSKLPIS